MKRKLLDTDVLSYYLKGVPSVVERAERYLARFGQLGFSTVTYYEIRRGVLHADLRVEARNGRFQSGRGEERFVVSGPSGTGSRGEGRECQCARPTSRRG